MNALPVDEAVVLAGLSRGGRSAEQAMEAAFEQWSDPLVNFLSRMTGNRATGEDLAQETLARLFREAPSLKPSGPLGGWLWTVAANLARDHLRRLRFTLATTGAAERSVAASPDPLEAQEVRDAVQKVLGRLPEPDRLCLLLKDVEETSYETLAGILGVSETTARVRVHRARERFRDLYRSQGGSEEEVRHVSA